MHGPLDDTSKSEVSSAALKKQVCFAKVAVMKRSAKPRAEARAGTRRRRSGCPIARALDLVGDKWTLLIVRDLLLRGKTTYNDMANSPERIPTSVLADRLRRLIDAGLIDRSPYQDNPVRYAYRLTAKGAALEPVLDEIIRWGDEHAP